MIISVAVMVFKAGCFDFQSNSELARIDQVGGWLGRQELYIVPVGGRYSQGHMIP